MDESQGEKLSRKMKDNPLLPIGMVGFVGALAYGAHKFRHRGDVSASFFLVQLRVAAQGMVVGSLCLGILYSVGKRAWHHLSPKQEHKSLE